MDIDIGDPQKETLEEIWNGERAEFVRNMMREGNFACCNRQDCPYCMGDGLEEIDEQEAKNYQKKEFADTLFVAYDQFCNHACPSCRCEVFRPDDAYKKRMQHIKEIVLPHANNVRTRDTCGRGDCFSSPYIMEFLQELRPVRDDYALSFETNGVLFDKEHWDKLKHLHPYYKKLIVTANSFDRETYCYLSGGFDNLERCMNNLHFASELRKKGDINEFVICMIVQESNYKQIPDFIQTCLSEFDPDYVWIKPINLWFGMSEEDYWFKNVLNPLHPYHKDYLRIMKHPLLQHPKVWDWTESEHDRREERHPAYRNQRYVEMLGRLLEHENPKAYIRERLHTLGVKKAAIYGTGMMGQKYYKLCCIDDIEIKYFIDKHNYEGKCCGLTIKQLYGEEFNDVDTILVSPVFFMDKIERELRDEGVRGQRLSVEKI